MRTTIKIGLLLAVLTAPLLAQNRFKPVYHITRSFTISGTPEVISIQNPLSDKRQANILGIFVSCDAACRFQVEMDGTSASDGTNISSTIVKGTKTLDAPRILAFAGSPTSSPRFVIPYTLSSQGAFPVPYNANYSLPGDGTGSNFTIRMVSGTVGTGAVIFIQWEEP